MIFRRKIKVSIIIPIHNTQDYLCACLDSVINQTLRALEIICIDDGSTDNSPVILREYAAKDKRIKIISQKNKGVAAARSRGLAIVRGEYVGFVDSDDWIDLNYYEMLYTEARRQKADIATAPYKINIRKNEELENIFNLEIKQRKAAGKLLPKYSATLTNWDNIYRLNFLRQNKINYYDELTYGSDTPFTVRAFFFSKKSIPVTGAFYHYRQNQKAQLTALSLDRINDEKKVYRIIFDFINSVNFANATDYLEVFAHYLQFMDTVFRKNMGNLKEFTLPEQEAFYKRIVAIYRQCKYPEQLKQDFPSLLYECLEADDFAKYPLYQRRREQRKMLNKLAEYSAAHIKQP